MRSSHSLDRIDVAFDGTQLVADAGLLLPATLAQHLDLKGLVDAHVDRVGCSSCARRSALYRISLAGPSSGPTS